MTYLETLKQSAEAIGLTLSDEALRRFEIYKDELLETNRFLNLTAITDPEEVAVKHMVDSLTIYNEKRFHNRTIADVGTGAGFPGLPLKIYDPTMRLTLTIPWQSALPSLRRWQRTWALARFAVTMREPKKRGGTRSCARNLMLSLPGL